MTFVDDGRVRKHRAPKGALRPTGRAYRTCRCDRVRKHRAPKGALRQYEECTRNAAIRHCQKAPSAKRCIKTAHLSLLGDFRHDLRQKAPNAKRCIKTLVNHGPVNLVVQVRKHRAPKGALRQVISTESVQGPRSCQKAPSAKRCIKTVAQGVFQIA